MVLPNFLNHCVILQALVGQVDNQKPFQEHSYSFLLHFSFAGRLSETRGDISLMQNVGTAKTAR